MSIDFAHFITHFSSAAHKKHPRRFITTNPFNRVKSFENFKQVSERTKKKIKSLDAAAANINV